MRRAKLTFEVDVEIDENDPMWEHHDLSLYSIGASFQVTPSYPDSPVGRAVRITKQGMKKVEYAEEEAEEKISVKKP